MAATRNVPRGYGTRAEVAEWLGYKPQTLANWKAQGKGPPSVGEGRTLRYRWAEVEKWDRARAHTP